MQELKTGEPGLFVPEEPPGTSEISVLPCEACRLHGSGFPEENGSSKRPGELDLGKSFWSCYEERVVMLFQVALQAALLDDRRDVGRREESLIFRRARLQLIFIFLDGGAARQAR